jgi:DNA polymerase III delta prime subunit
MLFKKYAEKFPLIIKSLINANKTNKLAHAYLLHGDSPEIRKEFASVIAQIVICPNKDAAGAPCSECKTCRQLSEQTYAELYTLSPVGKRWEIRIGESKNPDPNTVRWFEEQFYLTSIATANKKIGVIYDCDRMNTASQNAFLKTLEEPPRDSLFILATGNPSALLPTTRSRCQTLLLLENHCSFDFENNSELFAALAKLQFKSKNNMVSTEQCAAEIIAITKNLKDSAADRVEAEWEEKLQFAQELEPPMQKRIMAQFEAAVSGEYIRERNYFISALHTWFAQTYLLSCGAKAEETANPEIFKNLEIPSKINEEDAYKALQAVDKLLYELRFNVNEELALRSFCLDVTIG